MFKNYLTTTVGNLLKNKLFSCINVIGLSIGLAACILIALYVQGETSYDMHWVNAERIYQLNSTIDRTGSNPVRFGSNSFSAIPALKQFFPEDIAYAARVLNQTYEVQIDDQVFFENIPEADADIINIFDLEIVAGDLEATMEDPSSIALSEALAERLFGDEQILGRRLSLVINNGRNEIITDYSVTAVYRLPVGNTVLDLPAITLLDESRYSYLFNWLILSGSSFIQLTENADTSRINSQLQTFTDQVVDISAMEAGPDVNPSDRVNFDLQNIADVYLYGPGTTGGSITVVTVFSAISLLVLLIGCINFTVLSTSKAAQRAREVALRKVVGARRGELITQFLGESFLLVLFSLLVALGLVELVLPFFNTLVDKSLGMDFTSTGTWLALSVLLITVSVVGGFYPSFVLSGFRPATTLKTGKSGDTAGSVSFRNALVVFQFSISIALIVATSVIYLQVSYTVNRDPGFNKDNLIVIEDLLSRANVNAGKETLKQQLADAPGVTDVSLSGHQPMQRVSLSTVVVAYNLLGESGESHQLPTLSIDENFFSAYEIPLIAGRTFAEGRDQTSTFFDFTAERQQSYTANVVVNAATVRELGFDTPEAALGRQLSGRSSYNGTTQTLTIIGVVADTQFFSLRLEPRPEIYLLTPYFTDVLTVRYQDSVQQAVNSIDAVWERVMGSEGLSFSFVDQNMTSEFAREQTEARLLIIFSLLAIFIACLGLFGSTTFNIERRTKEIGIRKVMGAEVREIVTLLMWQFSKPVLIANIIAWPAALWAMLTWLQRFPYQIDTLLLIPLCVLAGFIALSIAWLTVAGNTVKVATTNPVYALRYE